MELFEVTILQKYETTGVFECLYSQQSELEVLLGCKKIKSFSRMGKRVADLRCFISSTLIK